MISNWSPAAPTSTADLSAGLTGLSLADVNSAFRDLDYELAYRLASAALEPVNLGDYLADNSSLRAAVSPQRGQIWIPWRNASPLIATLEVGNLAGGSKGWTLMDTCLYGSMLAPGEFIVSSETTTDFAQCCAYRYANFASAGTFSNGSSLDTKAYTSWCWTATPRYYRLNGANEVQSSATLTGTYDLLAASASAVRSNGTLVIVVGTSAATNPLRVFSGTTQTAQLNSISLVGSLATYNSTIGASWLWKDQIYLLIKNTGNTHYAVVRVNLDLTSPTVVLEVAGALPTNTNSQGSFGQHVMGFDDPTNLSWRWTLDGTHWQSLTGTGFKIVGNRLLKYASGTLYMSGYL